jgi:hypothetical protein
MLSQKSICYPLKRGYVFAPCPPQCLVVGFGVVIGGGDLHEFDAETADDVGKLASDIGVPGGMLKAE